MTKLEKQMLEVINSRKKDYMDYKDFCVLLPCLKEGIEMNSGRVTDEIRAYQPTVQRVYEFTRTMMAMKALRTLTCSKETFADCIIDFVNYKFLADEAFEKITNRCFAIYITLNPFMYNPKLNRPDIDINSINYIVNQETIRQLYKVLETGDESPFQLP